MLKHAKINVYRLVVYRWRQETFHLEGDLLWTPDAFKKEFGRDPDELVIKKKGSIYLVVVCSLVSGHPTMELGRCQWGLLPLARQ